jgi:hypothetical protein
MITLRTSYQRKTHQKISLLNTTVANVSQNNKSHRYTQQLPP